MSFSGGTERSTSDTEQQLHFSLGHLFTGWWSVIYFYWKARKALNLSFFYWSANVIRWTIWSAKWQLQEFETFRLAAFARYFFSGLFVPFIQIYFHIFLKSEIWIIAYIHYVNCVNYTLSKSNRVIILVPQAPKEDIWRQEKEILSGNPPHWFSQPAKYDQVRVRQFKQCEAV